MVLRIHTLKLNSESLDVDLKSCLNALSRLIDDYVWQIAPVKNEVGGEMLFDVTGALEPVFHALMTSASQIPTAELVRLSSLDHQLIWAELRGFEDKGDLQPVISIRAIDSTFFEIETENVVMIEQVKRNFKNVVDFEGCWGVA